LESSRVALVNCFEPFIQRGFNVCGEQKTTVIVLKPGSNTSLRSSFKVDIDSRATTRFLEGDDIESSA
jgi:hypothetical protein